MVILHLSTSNHMIIHFITCHLFILNIFVSIDFLFLKSVSAFLATAHLKEWPNVKFSHEENFDCPTSDWKLWLFKECAGECTLSPQHPSPAHSSLKPLNNIYSYLQSDVRRVGLLLLVRYVQVQMAHKHTQNEYESSSKFQGADDRTTPENSQRVNDVALARPVWM